MAGSRISLRYVIVAAVLILLFYIYPPFTFAHVPQYKSHHDAVFVKSSFDWKLVFPRYPVAAITPIPIIKPNQLPRIQHHFSSASATELAQEESKRQAVKKAFQKAYRNYFQRAWMRDELAPVSGNGKDASGGWAATLISSLDTLLIMGLEDEYEASVKAVVGHDWAKTDAAGCNITDVATRQLGGLLAAYDLNPQKAILDKAVELGEMLYAGFDTPNRMPAVWLDFDRAKTGYLATPERQSSASAGSLSLEFTRLSQLTGDPKYYDAAIKVTAAFVRHQMSTKIPGMWPEFINLRDEAFQDGSFTLGPNAGIVYDYLPKTHALLGGVDPIYENLYRGATKAMIKYLLFRPMTPDNADILFPGTVTVDKGIKSLNPEVEYQSCFAGSMFAFAGRLLDIKEHVEIGERLTRGCIWASKAFATGIMAQNISMIPCESSKDCEWDEERWATEGNKKLSKGFASAGDLSFHLRHEVIQSVFVLYRITGRQEFQDAAWDMFQAMQKATETKYANAAIEDVTATGSTTKIDSMETLWMAATLKYFYLTFSSPDLLSLDDYVFNKEGHPLKRLA